MSLAAMFMAMAAAKALDGRTMAADRVFDSEIDPRSLLGDDALPGLCVYTDAGRQRVEGKELFGPENAIEFTLLSFIAKAVTVDAGDGESAIELTFPQTDAGLRNALFTMHYQALKALHDPQNPWAEIWSTLLFRGATDQLTAGSRQTEFAFGGDSESGARFSVLRFTYRFDLIGDPVPFAPLSDAWEKVISAFEADAETAKTAKFIRLLVTDPTLPTWAQVQAELGLTRDGVLALGIGPLDEPTDAMLDAPAETAIEAEDKDEGLVLRVDNALDQINVDGGASQTVITPIDNV